MLTLTASGYPLIHSAFARCQERCAPLYVAPRAQLLGDASCVQPSMTMLAEL